MFLKKALFFCALIQCCLSLPGVEAQDEGFRAIKVIKHLSHQSGKLGPYRALIIGINDYVDPKIPDLETAVNDARALAKLLREKYGFRVELMLGREATKKAIYNAFRKLAASTKPDESVLIYYAGHGDLDRTYNTGWWIPVDAKGGDPFTYLDNVQVQNAMRAMKARHVLLVADSCYSGTLFGQARAMPPVLTDKYYLNLYNEKSRWGMTSGNKEPVSDTGTGAHSVFAHQLLKVLKQNDQLFLSTQEIYTRIAPIVSNNSEQTPLCRPVRNTGDQGGEFVFVSSGPAKIVMPSTQPDSSTLEVNASVSGASVLVDGRVVGQTPLSDVDVSPGEHPIRVEKEGYEPYRKLVLFEAGRTMSLYVDLNEERPETGRLFVDTKPEDAKVSILNIKPGFDQGMKLAPGKYHVEVSAEGYEKKSLWVNLNAGEDKTLDIRLEAVAVERGGKKISNSIGMEFVYIEPGTFMMGSPSNESGRDKDEKQHSVTLTKGFYMQTTEVTVGQWRAFVRDTGYKTDAETGGGAWIWTGSKWGKKEGYYWGNPGFSQSDDHPVTCVSWNDVQKFIRWLNRKEGEKYGLPTEAQWEYACRAGTSTARFWGDDPDDACGYANVHDQTSKRVNNKFDWSHHNCDDGYAVTAPVGSFRFNDFGLYDMIGNVWEWCEDRCNWEGKVVTDTYRNGIVDPLCVKGSYRVIRGGCWNNLPRCVRSAFRFNYSPGSRYSGLGFRLLRTQ